MSRRVMLGAIVVSYLAACGGNDFTTAADPPPDPSVLDAGDDVDPAAEAGRNPRPDGRIQAGEPEASADAATPDAGAGDGATPEASDDAATFDAGDADAMLDASPDAGDAISDASADTWLDPTSVLCCEPTGGWPDGSIDGVTKVACYNCTEWACGTFDGADANFPDGAACNGNCAIGSACTWYYRFGCGPADLAYQHFPGTVALCP